MLKEVNDSKEFNSLADHITQSWQWGQFRASTPSVKKVLRLKSENDVFQIFFHKIPHLPYTIAYIPRSSMPTNEEFEEIKAYCKKENTIFIKFEPLENTKYQILNTKYLQGKPILPSHTIYIDLSLSEDKLLSQMHEKTRYNIKLAQKKGVIVKEESSDEALESFIKLLESTESRQGFYSHYPDYYRKLWSLLKPAGMVHILNAYVPATSHQQLAASVMLFHFKDYLYYPYGGSNPEFRQFMAPSLLHFEAMKLGKKLKAKTYDLWGTYRHEKTEKDDWWGIYRFKSGFGGTEVDFQTFDIPLSPLYHPLMLAENLRWKALRLKKSFHF